MVSIKLDLRLNLRELINISRYSKQNQPILLQQAANRYVQYLRNRFIRLSAGGGEWPKLKRVTVISKIYRKVATNPKAILREYDELLAAIQAKNVGKTTFVGIVNRKRHSRGKTVTFLARVHTKGTRSKTGLVRRRVVAPPDRKTKRQMVLDIRNVYNKVIRNARRGR